MQSPVDTDAFLDLSRSLVSLFHVLKETTERLHAAEGLSAGERGILSDLVGEGPQTVPALARKRYMSRQNIQAIVDRLKVRRLCQAVANRQHRRSVLITATKDGRDLADRIRNEESQYLRGLKLPRAKELKAAADTLREVRAQLEGYLDCG